MDQQATAVTKTVVLGLKGAVIRSDDVRRIEDLVREVSEIRFHTFGILALYANLVADASAEMRDEDGSSGEVFHQTLIDQAMALARFADKQNDDAPEMLRFAAEHYFSGDLEFVRQTRSKSELLTHPIMMMQRINIRVAFQNCMELATPSHQKLAVQQLYGLTSKEAKLVCMHITTSRERLMDRALEIHVKRHKRIALRKRAELDKAIREDLPDVDRLQSEFLELERDVESRRSEAVATPELALESLRAEHVLKPRVRQAGFIGPLLSLSEIVVREQRFIPATQSQEHQLSYRMSLLRRLGLDGHEKLFNLTPVTSFRRTFVLITKDAAANLVPKMEVNGKRKKFDDYGDLNDLMPKLFKKDKLKRLVEKDSLCFGDSFRTDGIQLQVQVVNSANREAKARKEAAKKKTRLLKAEAAARGEEYVPLRPKKDKKIPSAVLPKRKEKIKAELVLPDDAVLVALDTGIKNIAGVAREDDIDNPFTLSTAAYRHAIGAKARERQLSSAEKWARINDPDFAAADAAVRGARTKTSDFLLLKAALHARGRHYRTLYAFYGFENFARQRFQNYIGAQRELHKLVKRVAPNKTDILVVGDADFGSVRKGLPAGVAGKFVKQCIRELGKDRVLFGDEFRSSCLDSTTKTLMFHPPKEEAVSKNGKRYLRRIYGLYQSSASGYSHLWNRDCNAARNIVINFRHLYENGEMPVQFRRETVLDVPMSLTYKWRMRPNGHGFIRWREPLTPEDPA